MTLYDDMQAVVGAALSAAMPDTAVGKALAELPEVRGRLVLVAAGKAAWSMAKAARDVLGSRIDRGIVITKHKHAQGPIGDLLIREASHPVPDETSYRATAEALALTEGLGPDDLVLFLLSGGGSALFEQPLIPAAEMEQLTRDLLACGAEITEINTLRKRLSAVKGGKFALHCAPARVFSVVLSDVIGDPLDMIASGPAYPDSSTAEDALAIVAKYGLSLSDEALGLLSAPTPTELPNVTTRVTGSVRELCAAAARETERLGYETVILTDRICCEAKDAGSFLASIARSHAGDGRKLAFLAGGEPVVHLTGAGPGGRNQELAVAAAPGIAGLSNVLVFSLGSDGTDGPTDAAGGFVDGSSEAKLRAAGYTVEQILRDNAEYEPLAAIGGLLMTGPTGTNVNDVCGVLIG